MERNSASSRVGCRKTRLKVKGKVSLAIISFGELKSVQIRLPIVFTNGLDQYVKYFPRTKGLGWGVNITGVFSF